QLESELDAVITAARAPLAVSQPGGAAHDPAKPCDVSEVVAERLEFWAVLATQQDRPWERYFTPRPTPVRFPQDELAAVVDALIGNVFRHTPQGTAFAVRVERADERVLFIQDFITEAASACPRAMFSPSVDHWYPAASTRVVMVE